MTPDEIEAERVKFEAHPKLPLHFTSKGHYNEETECAFAGWLAAKEDAKREIDELERELAEARKDAERYRWLRNSPDYDIWPPTKYPTYPWCVRGEIDHGIPASKFIAGGDLDAAIDAAIAKE